MTPIAAEETWTPQKQLTLEKEMTPHQIRESRSKLTAEEKTRLEQYIKSTKKPEPEKRIITEVRAPIHYDAHIFEKYTAAKEVLKETFNKDLSEIQAKIKRATPREQPNLYLQQEKLKEKYQTDLKNLADKYEPKIKLFEEGWTPQKQLDKEEGLTWEQWGAERETLTEDQVYAIEAYTQGLKEKWTPEYQLAKEHGLKTFAEWVDARKDLTEDQIFEIEAYTQGLEEKWTPEYQLAKEHGLKTFREWVDARKDLTEDQIFEIEAYTQGLEEEAWTPQRQLESEAGKSFAEWVDERKKLSEDQVFAIEAYTQGLKELSPEEIAKLEEEDRLRGIGAPPEEGERLTPEREEEERAAMEKAAAPIKPPAPELIIKRTEYPKWWRNAGVAPIDFSAPGAQSLVGAPRGGRLFIPTIVISVTEETVITINFGRAGSGGPIYLGGTDQPKGIVIAMGNSPAPCGSGGLSISATDPTASNPLIGGFATYYIEPEPE